jgi:hypothetical protein
MTKEMVRESEDWSMWIRWNLKWGTMESPYERSMVLRLLISPLLFETPSVREISA